VTDSDNTLPRQLSPDVLSALQGVRFIAQHIKDADKDNEVSLELRYCPLTLARLRGVGDVMPYDTHTHTHTHTHIYVYIYI
jgi:hypothetical protein